MSSWETYLEKNQDRFLAELIDFCRIASVSSLPKHADDVRKAANWVTSRLTAAGMENTRVMETGGHPVVYGDWLHAEQATTILIYGHFDTQPADPPDLWESPPFEPVVKNGRIYARGASDNKGCMLTAIISVEALLSTVGRLPVNVKFLLEGQEEIGSPQLPDFIERHKDLLACDLILSTDAEQYSETEPALLLGFKGLCALQIDVTGPNRDLHSGLFGGAIQNPIHALVHIIDSMRSPEGKILVPGFYDDVVPLSASEQKQIAAIPHDDDMYCKGLDVGSVYGEPGYSTLERVWARPTLEVNGIWGGFQEEGLKTILPGTAHAKISCRLVPGQNPETILKKILAHINREAPQGVQVKATPMPGSATAYLIPPDHSGNLIAGNVLNALYSRAPYSTRSGATLPICSIFLKTLKAYTTLFGWTLNDEDIHSPNEFFRLQSFERGQKGYCMILERLKSL